MKVEEEEKATPSNESASRNEIADVMEVEVNRKELEKNEDDEKVEVKEKEKEKEKEEEEKEEVGPPEEDVISAMASASMNYIDSSNSNIDSLGLLVLVSLFPNARHINLSECHDLPPSSLHALRGTLASSFVSFSFSSSCIIIFSFSSSSSSSSSSSFSFCC